MQAALSYLQESANQDQLIGVFLTDLSVQVLQPLAPDHELVKAGIQKAAVRRSHLLSVLVCSVQRS